MSILGSLLGAINGTLGSTRVNVPEPGSGFSISEFKSNAMQNGLLKKNLYMVNFIASPFPQNFVFLTDSVHIPQVNLETAQIRRYGYGPMESVPFRPVFSSMTITFMVDGSQQNVLSSVLNSISSIAPFMNYNDMNSTGKVNIYGASQTPTAYELAYKSDYSFDLEVYVYNEFQDNVLVYTFRDCFAQTVGGISLGWGDTDSLMKADVTFTFTDYSLNTLASDSTGFGGLQSILGLPSLVSTFNAIVHPQSIMDAINVNNARSFYGSTAGSASPNTDQSTSNWNNPDG